MDARDLRRDLRSRGRVLLRPRPRAFSPGRIGGYRLTGPDGEYLSETPGALGGHRGSKIYGRLDCPGALRWIARGHYVRHRVFFADEATAVVCGYRPCANCLPERYAAWKADRVGQ